MAIAIVDSDDEWASDDKNGWHSENCNCWECAIDYRNGCWDYDVDNLTDPHNTFLEIENNYFMGWADRKICPNQSLLQFFKCIQLCDEYNSKYCSDPSIKDTNHQLKLLKYHYNSLKYCVQIQYLLKKYNKDNSYSLLIYGYIRSIVDHDFDDDDDILIPFCLVNLCVVFYDELITNYSKLLHLTSVIENTFQDANDIKYITLNESKSKGLILQNTISFTLDCISGYEASHMTAHKHKQTEHTQLLWNTIIFLQMKNNSLWFYYAVTLCEKYITLRAYENSKNIIQYMDHHKVAQRIANRNMLDVTVIAKYYSYKIANVLIDIIAHHTIHGTKKTQLMQIYNESVAVIDSFPRQYELYEIFCYYFKMFLLLEDYENTSRYLQNACKLYYDEYMYRGYDIHTDEWLLEYNLLLYVLMNGTNAWDSTLFDSLSSRNGSEINYDYRRFYLTTQYLVIRIYDLCQRFPQYQVFVHSLFRGDEADISRLLSLNNHRQMIDQFLFEKCIRILKNRRENEE